MIGLPVGVSLALATDLGSIGMWIGLALASNVQCVGIGITVAQLNWTRETERAMKRVGGQSRPQDRPHPPDKTKREEGDSDTGDKDGSVVQLVQYSQLRHNEDDQLKEQCNDNTIPSDSNNDMVSNDTEIPAGENGTLLPDGDVLPSDDTVALIEDNEGAGDDNEGADVNFKDRVRGRLKLICCHVSLVVTACVCLIAAGVLSMYRPPDSIVNGNYSECTFTNDTDTLF